MLAYWCGIQYLALWGKTWIAGQGWNAVVLMYFFIKTHTEMLFLM